MTSAAGGRHSIRRGWNTRRRARRASAVSARRGTRRERLAIFEVEPLQTGLFPFHSVTRSKDERTGTQCGADRGRTLETELVALHMVHTGHRDHHPVIRHLDEL